MCQPVEQYNTFCHIYKIIWEFGQATTDSLVISVSSQKQSSDAFYAQNGHVERREFSGYVGNEVDIRAGNWQL